MRNGIIKALAFTVGLTALASGVRAQDPGSARQFADFVTRGALAQGESEFARRPSDPQAVAALGMIRFLRAVERLGQGLHRHGLHAPSGLPAVPVLRLPVPPNPNPEPLTYEKLRAIYATFLADLTSAEQTLASLPSGQVKLPIDLMQVRLDLDGNGVASDAESLGAIFVALSAGGGRAAQAAAPQPLEVAFDRADVVWLRGYSRLISAFMEFVLAHDWSDTYAGAAHLFFAGAQDPSGRAAAQQTLADLIIGSGGDRIADVIALVHLIRWPVAEPARMGKAREHLKAVVALSRENWKEILAETDDDREWLPGPHQKNSAFPTMSVTRERVDGWLRTLDVFEEALDGKKLVPHWRYKQGLDLNAVFTSPRHFDLVLWLTGHAALPYLKEGPTLSRQDWGQWERIFGGNFLAYAFWFN